jgi:hypothetical protein
VFALFAAWFWVLWSHKLTAQAFDYKSSSQWPCEKLDLTSVSAIASTGLTCRDWERRRAKHVQESLIGRPSLFDPDQIRPGAVGMVRRTRLV